jgi:hypothetical protein
VIQVLALRAFVAIWTRAIALSKKLSPRTWKLLTAIQCGLLVVPLCGLYLSWQAERELTAPSPDPAHYNISGTVFYAQPGSKPLGAFLLSAEERPLRLSLPQKLDLSGYCYSVVTLRFGESGYFFHFGHVRGQYWRSGGASTLTQQAIKNAIVSSEDRRFAFRQHHTFPSGYLQEFKRLFEPARYVTVQLSELPSSDYKTLLMFWLSLFSLIMNTGGVISTGIVSWISLHMQRAEQIRKQAEFLAAQRALQLELEKKQLEIERLRFEVEKMRQEAQQKQPLIVLASS